MTHGDVDERHQLLDGGDIDHTLAARVLDGDLLHDEAVIYHDIAAVPAADRATVYYAGDRADGEIRGVINAEAIATEDELLRVLNSYLREER
jgi:hypothetical protein